MKNPRYLVFDAESIADGNLVSRLKYPDLKLPPDEAVARYRAELMQEYGNDFIPYTFQVPISIAIAKVAADFELLDLVVLDDPHFRPHVIAENFWRGWEAYQRPALVTFNGRTFDLPLLELAAFRFGLSIPGWFNLKENSYQQHRNRFNIASHIDLQELLTNFGATRFSGGLNLAANLLGKPGKMDVQGAMVQDMYDAGQLAEINGYCCCDVLDTYFVFLRSRVLLGEMKLEREHELVDKAKVWIEAAAETQPAYGHYLTRWGDWANPWEGEQAK